MSVIAGTAAVPAADTGTSDSEMPARRLTAEAAALQRKFPPRVPAVGMWPATLAGRDVVVRDVMSCPYAGEENYQARHYRRLGVTRMLDWLEAQPGTSWQ